MKKALAILSALALVAGAAFAEAGVSVGGWGRMGVNPLVGSSASGSTVTASTDPTWANGGRVGVNFAGHSDNVGFNLNIDSNGTYLGVGDQAKIWVKANDMFKFEFGKIQGDVLRGKFGDWGLFGYSAGGEDDIFARFYPKAGLLLNVTPVEGLYIGAAVDVGTYTKSLKVSVDEKTLAISVAEDYATSKPTAEDMFKGVQVGAGYTIANVGLLRAQFIGSAAKNDAGDIQVAFNLTGVPNLSADIGGTFDLATTDPTHKVAAGFGYNADALSITVRGLAKIAKKVGFGAAAKVEYAVASPLSVGLTAGYEDEDARDTGTINLQPYAKLGYSNGYVAASFKAAITGSTTTWAVPLFAEYWF